MPPTITLTGDAVIVVTIGNVFTDPDPGFDVSNNDPPYTGTVTTTITDDADPTNPPIDTINTATTGAYTITYTAPPDGHRNTSATVTRTVRVVNPIDIDGDRLIEIDTLEGLNAIRHNLAGTSYRASARGTETLCGTGATTACRGYELMRDLDFASGDSYASGTVNPTWRPTGGDPDSATNPGWEPIGILTGSTAFYFSGSFSGNGFTISNLYVRRSGFLGLFSASNGTIERIGVVNVNIYGRAGNDNIGGVVGVNRESTVTASYGFGTVMGDTIAMPRSDDTSLPATVANACALTQALSSMTPANRWSITIATDRRWQWDFGTAKQRPILLYNGTSLPRQTEQTEQTERGC